VNLPIVVADAPAARVTVAAISIPDRHGDVEPAVSMVNTMNVPMESIGRQHRAVERLCETSEEPASEFRIQAAFSAAARVR